MAKKRKINPAWIAESLIPPNLRSAPVVQLEPLENTFDTDSVLVNPISIIDYDFDTDLSELSKKIREAAIDCEERLVLQVFEQYLGRTPLLEDAIRGMRVTHELYFDRYILCIDGNQLGMVFRDFERQNYSVKFVPGLTVFKR